MTDQATFPSTPAPSETAVPDDATANLAGWSWIPIRSLAVRHRSKIVAHLQELPPHDRYLRFGYAANDAQIVRYADAIDFDRDELFGIFDRQLAIVALSHLAYSPAPQRADDPPMAEFGVSVLASARGRGFGRRLFDHAALHARNRGVDTLFIYALTENAPMLCIARAAGATVERSGSESEAWLKLPPDTVGTHLDEAIEQHAAEMDYRWKVQLTRFNVILEAIAEIKSRLNRKSTVATQ